MRVLVCAFACSPVEGSESGLGWNWVRQIARFHEVWVITWAANRPEIERALAHAPLENVHWVYVDLPFRRWLRYAKVVPEQLYYYLWQVAAALAGRTLCGRIKFHLSHHVTFSNACLPSFLALLPAPFLWGPVGGGDSAPWAFYAGCSLHGRLYESGRDLARHLTRWDPFLRITMRRAAATLATTPAAAERLRRLGGRYLGVLSNVALPADEIDRLSAVPFRSASPFRVLSMGRLLPWKGFHLGLAAFAGLHRILPDAQYWITGDGPERHHLERSARRLGIQEQVRLWGDVGSRDAALSLLSECDALVHPALHETGGWVCAEAMAAGRPVICLDAGGPGLQVTAATGVKVPVTLPEKVVQDLTEAMLRLARDQVLRKAMGEAGRQRVREHFCWADKGEWIHSVYRVIPGSRATGDIVPSSTSS